MVATCQAKLDQATALGNSVLGTRFGIMARWAGVATARTTPKAKATPRMPAAETWSNSTMLTSTTEAATSAVRPTTMITRRSKRSAIWPVTKARQKAGRNSISPTRPSWKGLPVRS
jgi:hypothetical protein